MPDVHKNFAASLVATAPSPATSGTSLVVTTGEGAKFPAVPFNATICPASTAPTTANAEIVRVTAVSTDTLTITRIQESTSARTVIVGDQIFAGITAQTLLDAENSSSAPVQYLIFHGGVTGTYTLTPLTAGTVEPANTPMTRLLTDTTNATQMRLVIGQRVIGSGGTTCAARLQYSTNGATQTTWADANNSGSGVDLQSGTANTLHDAGFVNLAAGAIGANTYFRLAIVTTGTVTTAPTLSKAEVHFK